MDSQARPFAAHQQAFMDRFVAVCQADQRVVAAFLGGSYVKGTADASSDLDLTLITTDAAYEDFAARRKEFLGQLGELVFLEDFDQPHWVFFILSDGTEGEIWLGGERHLDHIHSGPYKVLLDTKSILADAVFPEDAPTQAEQIETLRRLLTWFWHDLSHFTTAMARGQLWWAHGQLEGLRRYCVQLARLRHNFAASADGYDKLDLALPVEQLSPLQASYCEQEYGAMLQAADVIVQFYQELAPLLALTHGLPYPAGLERVMVNRLEQLSEEQSA
jgi:predicted nucleotidyltransferase